MSVQDCWAVTASDNHGKLSCDGDADICIPHDRGAMWTLQYNALQSLDLTKAENADFKLKWPTPVCVFCSAMWDLLAETTPTKRVS